MAYSAAVKAYDRAIADLRDAIREHGARCLSPAHLDALHIATNSLNIHTLVILWDAHPAAYADLPDRVKLAIEAYQRAKR
jgi:hypothetical protein